MAELDDTGFVPETQGERKSKLDAGMLEAFPPVGNEFLTLNPDSYTGRSNEVLAEQLVTADNLTAAFLDILDPQQSTGVWTDLHMRLQATRRKPATRSTIPGLLQGVPGTLVGDKQVRFLPNDTLWRTPLLDKNGDPLAIEANGFLRVTLTATVDGPIDAVETGTASWLIVDQVTGWSNTTGTVESTGPVRLGTDIESDSVGRTRLTKPSTSALGGAATKPAIVKALNEIPGVVDADINNNRKLVPVDGIPPKSIEAIVEGGDLQTIANTLLGTYQGTAGYFGNTTLEGSVAIDLPDGRTLTVTEQTSWTTPTLVAVVARYVITYGRLEFAPDDGGIAIALEVASAYINEAGRGVDVIPTASAAAIVAALPPASEPTIAAEVALKGSVPSPAPIPITDRQKASINPEPQVAEVTSTLAEPYVFTVTWVLALSVDGGPQVAVTFAATDFDNISQAQALEIANVIALQVDTLDAGVDEARVQFASKTSGAASSVEILAATSAGLLATLGLVAGTTLGTDGDIEVTFS